MGSKWYGQQQGCMGSLNLRLIVDLVDLYGDFINWSKGYQQ